MGDHCWNDEPFEGAPKDLVLCEGWFILVKLFTVYVVKKFRANYLFF